MTLLLRRYISSCNSRLPYCVNEITDGRHLCTSSPSHSCVNLSGAAARLRFEHFVAELHIYIFCINLLPSLIYIPLSASHFFFFIYTYFSAFSSYSCTCDISILFQNHVYACHFSINCNFVAYIS